VQRRQAVRQASGALDKLYGGFRAAVLDAMALVESAIDFSDEADVSSRAVQDAEVRIDRLVDDISRHLVGANRGEIIRDGFRVVLAGAPNVGKSSLLNALARRDVAIVSEEAGTTRDVIEVRLDLGGYPVIVTDTAGLRAAGGAVELEGMRRTRERARAAHLVLWVTDATASADVDPEALDAELGPAARLVVANKCDLATVAERRGWVDVSVSARTGEGLDVLIDRIAAECATAAEAGSSPGGELVPTNARHRLLLSDALAHLQRFRDTPAAAIELRAEDLRLAANALGRLTGRIDPEEVLGAIFGRFCIGK
jgi:tRNA modification GTPase